MKKSTIFYTSEFGERILVRRCYLPSSLSKESVVLLAEMLNASLDLQKKSISNYASAKLVYSVSYFRGGYLLEAKLTQAQVQGLTYAFINPYKKACAILNDLSDVRIVKDEKVFAICKERLLSYTEHNHLDQIKSEMHLDFAPVSFDRNLLSSIKLDDVFCALKVARESKIGDYLYVGPQGKQNPFFDSTMFDTSLCEVEGEIHQDNETVVSSQFEKESKVYVISLKEEVKDYSSYLRTKEAFDVMISALSTKLNQSFGSKIYLNMELINQKYAFLSASVYGNKMSILEPKLDEAIHSDFVTDYAFEEGQVMYRQNELLKCIYSEKAVSNLLKLMALGVDAPTDYLTVITNEQEKVKDVIKNVTFLTHKLFVNEQYMKEVSHD